MRNLWTSPFTPLLQLSDLSAPSSSQPVLAIKKNKTTDYLQNFFLFFNPG